MKNVVSFPMWVRVLCAALVLPLCPGWGFHAASGASVVISEFMAANSASIRDEDQDASDWIEIWNSGTEVVRMEGWSLTDTATQLSQWTFPNTNLNGGDRLIVFASGKDRRRPGRPLHTNFRLSGSGEYLALVMPDGSTVASQYSPSYPAQVENVSYGLDPGLRPVTLISTSSVVRWRVPGVADAGLAWTQRGFDDAGWSNGAGGLGYFRGSLGAQVDAGLKQGLVGYWPMDENSGGVAQDFSGQQNAGAVSNVTTGHWILGLQGGALRLRGSSTRQYVRVANYPKATVGLSVAAWVMLDARSGAATILRNGGGTNVGQFQLGTRSGTGELEGVVRTAGGLVGVTDSVSLATGVWHHVVLVADGASVRLFRNGQLVGGTNVVSPLVSTAYATLSMGVRLNVAETQQDGLAPAYLNGRLDDVAVWTRALGEGEVAQLAYSGGSQQWVSGALSDVGGSFHGANASAWLRIPFVVNDPSTMVQWRLSMLYQDGAVVWLNGEELLRRNAPEALGWDSAALETRDAREVREWEVVKLDGLMGGVVAGTNVLAVQWMKQSADSPSALWRCLLEASSTQDTTNAPVYFTQPTPGTPNLVGTTVVGPVMSQAGHTPTDPTDADDLSVTVKVAPAFAPVAEVTMKYRVMYSNEVSVVMLDDGQHGDGAAGDGVYGAKIPAELSKPGQMVRYAFVARDAMGTSSRLPQFATPADSSEYFGAVVEDPSIQTGLPVVQWFVRQPSAAESDVGTRCSIYYGGEFYDNVYIRIRGGTSRSWPKKSYKVEMNSDHEFLIHPGVPRVTEFDMNTTYTDKSYVRAVLHYELQRDAGQPSPETFHLHLRQNGVFYSVTLFTEQPDKAFLRRNSLDDQGALYKVGPGGNYDSADIGFEKKTRPNEGTDDLKALIRAVTTLTGPALEQYVFDNVDLPGMVSYMATVAIAQNIDGTDKNHFLYRDTRGSGEWRMLPWDLDLSFGPNALNTDVMVYAENFTSHPYIGARPYMLHDGKYNRLIEAVIASPRFRQMLLRRIRTLCEAYLVQPYFQNRLTELEALLAEDAVKDRAKWKTDTHFGGDIFTLKQAMDRIRNEYLTPRPGYLMGQGIVGVTTNNPGGQPWGPDLKFVKWDATPASGTQDQEFIQITNRTSYPVDLSGWKLEGDVEHEFRAGTVVPPADSIYVSPNVAAFRARTVEPKGGQRLFVVGNYRGQLSARGGVLRLVSTTGRTIDVLERAGAPGDLQRYLRISEIHAQPAAFAGGTISPGDGEFVEVHNISQSVTLRLDQARFTGGIEFDFSQGLVKELAPGGYAVVVARKAAFENRYGTGRPVCGEFAGRLDNDGEILRLEDAQGEVIQEIRYRDTWFPMASQHGFSMTLSQPESEEYRTSEKAYWRVSSKVHGSPGALDPAPALIQPVYINEVLSAPISGSDQVELVNPGVTPAAIGGWYLTDDFSVPRKYRFPVGRVIPAGGYEVTDDRAWAAGAIPFKLQADGDDIWLFSADASGELTGYYHGFRFGPASGGVSLGRQTNSVGEEVLGWETRASLGGANGGGEAARVWITEISPEGDGRGPSFVELWNPGTVSIGLGGGGEEGTSGWKLSGDVDFEFPPGLVMAAGERLLVVSFDPLTDAESVERFRGAYAGAVGRRIVGPWTKTLTQLSLNLEAPIVVSGTNQAYRVVDSVDQTGLWPTLDLVGKTTWQRREWFGRANDPLGWSAALSSPGAALVQGPGPTFTKEPADASVVAFQRAVLESAAAGGSRLGFQWLRNGVELPGGAQGNLVLDPVSPDGFGSYRVAAFDESGTLWSREAILDVELPAYITQQPFSRLVRGGSNVTFTVRAMGRGNLSYQWLFNGNRIEGATQPSYVRPAVTAADSGRYTVQVRDAVGVTESDPAILTVAVLPRIVQHPQDYGTVVGGQLRMQVVAEGTSPMGIRWRRNNSFLSGQNSSVLVVSNVTLTFAGNYVAVITNFAGSVTSQIARVVVDADADKDGVSDLWEVENGFSSSNAADALLDGDGDGFSNRDEWVAGTDPRDATSYLRLDVLREGGGYHLEWEGQAGKSYEVLSRRGLEGEWGRWQTVPTLSTGQVLRFSLPSVSTNSQEWFRVKTPWAP